MIYVVIPVKDRRELTRSCLSSLSDQSLPHAVVVVDAASRDGTPQMIRADYPETTLLRVGGDLWWTGATNRGVAWVLARGEEDSIIVTLNDDTLVAPNYLARLTAPLQTDRRMLLGSVSTREADATTIVDGGVRIDWWRAKYSVRHRGEDVRLAYPDGGLQDVDVLSGCGTAIPIEAFRELGLYDERHLPHYAGDYEFSRRAAAAGYRLAISADAVLRLRERSTGIHGDVEQGSAVTLARSFVSRRSATNLSARVNFAFLAAPRRALIPYLACDLIRVLVGSLRRSLRRSTTAGLR